MKKLLFLLLCTVSLYGQTYQNPTFGTVTTKTSPMVTNDPYLTTTGTTGIQGKIAPANVLIPYTPINYSISGQTIGQQIAAIDSKIGTMGTTDAVLNKSTVSGTTATDALNTLNTIKLKNPNWKTPQDYGAIGDGVADDTEAIRACFASNNNILLYGEYKVTDFIEILDNQFIFSNNAIIKRTLAGDSAIFAALNRFGFQITGKLTLEGDGDGSTVGESAGISVAGCDGFYLDGITIKNIKGIGLKIDSGANVMPRGDGARISNLQLIQNYIGVNTGHSHQAEYHSFTNINATECGTGLKIQGGNISFSGGNIVDNNIGIYIGGTLGTNNSHGILNGININHNALNLRVYNADLGQSISACHFYGKASSNIEIINSKGIVFSNCIIDGKFENVDSLSPTGAHLVSNCQIGSATTFVGVPVLKTNNITLSSIDYVGNDYTWGLGGASFMYAGAVGKRFAYADPTLNILYSGTGGFGINNQAGTTRLFDLTNAGVLGLDNLKGTGTRQVVADASGNLSATTPQPLKYVALISQTGTGNPVATVLENTLGGTVVWTRQSVGSYVGTLNGAFKLNKTWCISGINVTTGSTYHKLPIINQVDVNRIIIEQRDTSASGTLSDSMSTHIEVRVYP